MMERSQHQNLECLENVALYVLGCLDREEQAAFEAHLRDGCVDCRSQLPAFAAVTGDLALAPSPVSPAPNLRERLLASLGPSATSAGSAKQPQLGGVLFQEPGLLIARSADIPWQSAALPGIFTKPLYVDPLRQYTTALVRMEAGVRYPPHRHADLEELYVMDGDLLVENQAMRAGDYCRAEAGTIHHEVSTVSGCLFLVLSSQRDEILARSIWPKGPTR